jgi:glutamate formiminotransferase
VVKLIEAIPNVSEGRRISVVEALAAAVDKTPGARLLDYSADPSHNRSVYTLVGDAPALLDAVVRLVRVAVREIDLGRHTGAHPRIGAVDVVPFVPLGDTPLSDCVTLARSVAEAVANRFAIPILLYEAAATAPGRRRLEDIRRGQFEGLADRMRRDGHQPDFGPAVPHPSAGATAIGARGPLVAYNVNLATADIEIARRIARSIRERAGGLPGVKAMGIALTHRGLAQVSMNLTDYRRTDVPEAFAFVKREASRLGVGIADSEIVGLAPADALAGATGTELQLDPLSLDRVLETRLAAPPAASSGPLSGIP